ncbi:MAG TPA: SH3 domain-containing protein [Gammaproteobacteria bacterium]|nr:SH3 domain-containing protein [Gammaproteobacteria bacterium]
MAPLAIAVLVSACAGSSTTPAPQPAVSDVVATVAPPAPTPPRDDAQIASLQRQIADLELKVLEKGAQVEELQTRLDDARREVVRALAKLQSQATRAEAASGMAEAELALQSLSPGGTAEVVAEVRRLMAQSSAEFDKQNYGGALYLANQAKSAVTTAHGQLARVEHGAPRPGERTLALPLRLETKTNANVREGPGVGFAVVFTLPARAAIVAYSSTEQWLQIADDSGRRGWISQSLIRGQP